VVAEGVETQQQLDFLRDNHCDEFQGYYFGRPLPGADFVREFLQLPAQGEARPGPSQSP